LDRGLPLAGKYYTNIYLGYVTTLGSPGAVPGTLSSRWGVWVLIPLPRVLKVSIGLDLEWVYFADIGEAF